MTIRIPNLPDFPTNEIMRILADPDGAGSAGVAMLSGLVEMLYPHRWLALHRHQESIRHESGPNLELGVSLTIQYQRRRDLHEYYSGEGHGDPAADALNLPAGKIELLLTEHGLFETTNHFQRLPENRLPFAAKYRDRIEKNRTPDPYEPPESPERGEQSLGDFSDGQGFDGNGRGRNLPPPDNPGGPDGPDGDDGSGLRDVIAHSVLFSDPDRVNTILESI